MLYSFSIYLTVAIFGYDLYFSIFQLYSVGMLCALFVPSHAVVPEMTAYVWVYYVENLIVFLSPPFSDIARSSRRRFLNVSKYA